jgi:hypothetical protein
MGTPRRCLISSRARPSTSRSVSSTPPSIWSRAATLATSSSGKHESCPLAAATSLAGQPAPALPVQKPPAQLVEAAVRTVGQLLPPAPGGRGHRGAPTPHQGACRPRGPRGQRQLGARVAWDRRRRRWPPAADSCRSRRTPPTGSPSPSTAGPRPPMRSPTDPGQRRRGRTRRGVTGRGAGLSRGSRSAPGRPRRTGGTPRRSSGRARASGRAGSTRRHRPYTPRRTPRAPRVRLAS